MNVSKELIAIANNRAFAYSIKGKNNQHLMSELLSVTSFLDNHYSDVTLGQRGWHVRHNDYNLQLCPVCNRPMIYNHGYYAVHPECMYKKIASTMKERPQEIKDKQYEKIRQTTKKRYGVSNAMKCEEIKEKKRKTNLERYGVPDPQMLPENRKKINETMIERYGGVGYASYKYREQKLKQSKLYKHILKNDNLEYIKQGKAVGNKTVEHIILCKKCNKTFSYVSGRRYRINHSIELRPNCNPKSSAKSLLEVELQDYIREIYNGTVIDNCKSVIKNVTKNNAKLELDVYLPDLKLAFEFNGDQFHCNPKFYSSTDVSRITHKLASSIWKKDARKAELCKQKGIILFVVWEDDWIHQQQQIKADIKSLINKSIC